MTTKHSLLLRGALVDSKGKSVRLGRQIGKGGEGIVFEVEDRSDGVAKIYHQTRMDRDTVAKIEVMVAKSSQELTAVSAWPESILYQKNGRQPCGILMPHIKNARQLHELYGTANRRMHFPGVRWHHLLLAARNLAAAFDTLHTTGIVIGDVNQGNLLVDNRMRVNFIDCDSFQITSNGNIFHCPVGTPHFTPSELQSTKLREVARTIDHDCFGLAVLIFHLLFVGRHPFAGRFRGQGDLSIERAIAERRFAFSRDRATTLVDPPPSSLALDDMPPALGDLFEAAFCGSQASGKARPTPAQWVEQLDALMRQRQICSFDELHVHYDKLKKCPWCRIEDEGGPSFFVADSSGSMVSKDRLGELDRRIGLLQVLAFPELSLKRLKPPGKLVLKALKEAPKPSSLDLAAGGMVLGAAVCLAGVVYAPALLAGAALCIGSGAYLLRSSKGQERRKREAQLEATLEQHREQLIKMERGIKAGHQKKLKTYERMTAELKTAVKWYRTEGEQLQEMLKQHRSTHQTEYLRRHIIREHIQEIPEMTNSIVAMLESFNVETALSVDQLMLAGIPNISSVVNLELMQWRALLERKFEFQPDHGVTEQHLKLAEMAATQRFKVAQARKVLMGSKQLDVLAHAGSADIMHAMKQFDKVAAQATAVARELREHQSARRKIERSINRSPIVILGLALGIPILGYLFYVLFG